MPIQDFNPNYKQLYDYAKADHANVESALHALMEVRRTKLPKGTDYHALHKAFRVIIGEYNLALLEYEYEMDRFIQLVNMQDGS